MASSARPATSRSTASVEAPSGSAGVVSVDGARQADRQAGAEERRGLGEVGVAQGLHRTPVGDVGIGAGGPRRLDDAGGHGDGVEGGQRLGRRPLRRPPSDRGVDLVAVAPPVGDRGEALQPLGPVEQLRDPLELRVVHADDGDPAVEGRHAVERGAPRIAVADPLGQALVLVHVEGLVPQDRQQAVEHGDVDVLAEAVVVALAQGRQDPHGGEHGGDLVADGRSDLGGRPVGEPGLGHEAADRLDGEVHRRSVAVGAVGPVPGDRAGDDPRVAGRQGVVVEAQGRHGPGDGVLDQHVAHLDEAQQHVAALGLLEVEHHAALAAALAQRADRDVALAAPAAVHAVGPHHRRHPPGRVAARRLDADHLGAQRRQVEAARRPGHDPAHVEHPDALERLHREPSVGAGLGVRGGVRVGRRRPGATGGTASTATAPAPPPRPPGSRARPPAWPGRRPPARSSAGRRACRGTGPGPNPTGPPPPPAPPPAAPR